MQGNWFSFIARWYFGRRSYRYYSERDLEIESRKNVIAPHR